MTDNSLIKEIMKKYYLAVIMIGVLVLAVLIQGFGIIGSPFKQMDVAKDQKRISDFVEISYAIEKYASSNKALPEDLKDITLDEYAISKNSSIIDAQTGAPYGYKIKSKQEYELCTTFDTSNYPTPGPLNSGKSAIINIDYDDYGYNSHLHYKGYNCLTFKLNT